MKKLLLTIMMAAVIGTPAIAQAPRNGHATPAAQTMAQTDTAGIEAYSDTTMVSQADTSASPSQNVYDKDNFIKNFSLDDVDDPFNLIAYLTTIGVGGVIVAVFFVMLCLLTVFSPVILIVVVLYMVFRRKKERYRIIEKAMETGEPIPDELRRTETMSPDMLWRKGIRNASIGLGILALALCIGSEFIGGVGLLVAFYGVGQAVIARTTGKKDDRKDDDGIEEL